MNPNPVTLSRRLSFLSLSLGLQSLCLSQSLRQPATARPFSLSISHTSPSPSVSHLALDSKRKILMEGVEGGDAGSAVAPLAKWRDEFSRTFQSLSSRPGNICGSSAIGGNQQLYGLARCSDDR